MKLWKFRTLAGRIVYRRRKHVFKWRDVLRILFRLDVQGETELGQASLALLQIELMIELGAGNFVGSLNLSENWPIWWNQLEAQSKSRWMTELNNLYPEEILKLWIAHESWRAAALIRQVQELEIQKLIVDLTAENEALKDQVAELTRRLAAKK